MILKSHERSFCNIILITEQFVSNVHTVKCLLVLCNSEVIFAFLFDIWLLKEEQEMLSFIGAALILLSSVTVSVFNEGSGREPESKVEDAVSTSDESSDNSVYNSDSDDSERTRDSEHTVVTPRSSIMERPPFGIEILPMNLA